MNYQMNMSCDYFKGNKVGSIRKLAGGDTYTIICLKMLLWAQKNGNAFCCDDDFCEEVAAELGEDAGDLEVAMKCMIAKKLLLPCDVDAKPRKKETKKEKTTAKAKYGDFQHVTLTESEYQRLVMDYGEETTLAAVKYLDEFIEEKGYKSKNNNLAIRRWVIDAVKKKNGNRHRVNQFEDLLDKIKKDEINDTGRG